MQPLSSMIISTVFCSISLFFILLRTSDICSLLIYSTPACFLFFIACIAMATLFVSPSKTFGYMLRRLVLIGLVSGTDRQHSEL
jgi:hypothetical protein